ncbi:e3 ubiquitin-protein ligase RNF13 [Trichonephila clavipes]|nr:e3 ubiquitin-protein ligase RNF13 [Trichonephila clavipes]
MTTHTITLAVGAMCHCKAKAGLRCSPRGPHTRTRLSLLLRLNLDSSLQTTWFHSAAVQFPLALHHSKRRRRWWVSRAAHVMVMGATIPNVLQPGAFDWFEDTQRPLMKELLMPEGG